jgi:mevalonate kinase
VTLPIEACGKFILTGEHFILYDTPALVLPWSGASLRLVPPHPEARLAPAFAAAVQEAWQGACELVGLEGIASFPYHIESSIPIGCGFGSSAALCVALLRVATARAGVVWDDTTLIAKATELEGMFHGRSSGLDPAIAVLQAPLRFRMGPQWTPFAWDCEGWGFVLAVTPESRQTAKAVAQVRHFSESEPERFAVLLDEMQQLIVRVEALASCAPDVEMHSASVRGREVGELLTRNHRILTEVGVSSPSLERFVEAALAAGAAGAKLTGAGQGGAMFALGTAEQLPAIAEALLAAGAHLCESYLPSSLSVAPGDA